MKDIRPVKNWGRFVGGDILTGALHIAAVVTTTIITISSNKIHDGDVVVLADPGPPGK